MNILQAYRREEDDHFFVMDQLKLPSKVEEIRVNCIEDSWKVIKDMNVRGAPLISVVATQGLRVELYKRQFQSLQSLREFVLSSVEYLRSSRPTAVNLQNDTERILLAALNYQKSEQLSEIQGIFQLRDSLSMLIDSFPKQYEDACKNMSVLGVDTIISDFEAKFKKNTQSKSPQDNFKLKVLTICNTGKLATPGDGTALGIVRELHRRGRLERLYISETRPYNQGARLTASEAIIDQIPSTLITDSMAGFLMQQGNVDFVVVGADRVAKNGDTANKIGTYTLAVLAKHHNVNFYVALPTQTIDLNTLRGSDIHIEQRSKQEVTHVMGVQIAPNEIDVWNPSFDVTPSSLITRIFHENGEYECDRSIGNWQEINIELLKKWLIEKYKLFSAEEGENLSISEVGDGNLNLVFLVSSPKKQVIVKQALPYVRCVGPSWPFPLSRAYFEHEALVFQDSITNGLVPKPLLFDKEIALIVMEYLPSPYIILRKGMLLRKRYPQLAQDIAIFSARTHFFSSPIHLSNEKYRVNVAKWCENTEMSSLTEQVIFSDPYIDSHFNRWTTPQLDTLVSTFKTNDDELVLAIADLRHRFITAKEALIHGDLHTGSIMVSSESTKVIDPEFAFYGPIGFDLGAFIANLLLSFFSQKQHQYQGELQGEGNNEIQLNVASYCEWILQTALDFQDKYSSEFMRLWNDPQNVLQGGDFTSLLMIKSEKIRTETQKRFLKNIFHDTLGFTAAKMIRRIIGIAHVEDLDSINDQDIRSHCEKPALLFARDLMVNRYKYEHLSEVLQLARTYYSS